MLKPEQVPDEVVAAAREAWLGSDVSAQEDWRIAIAAAINAWPGNRMETEYFTHCGDYWEPAVILPLPQESGDE